MRAWKKIIAVWLLVLGLGISQVSPASPPFPPVPGSGGKLAPLFNLFSQTLPDEMAFAIWLPLVFTHSAWLATSIWKSGPEFKKALADLWQHRDVRRAFREWQSHLEEFQTRQAPLLSHLEKAAKTHGRIEQRLSLLLEEYNKTFRDKLSPLDQRLLDTALADWNTARDMTEFQRFVRSHRDLFAKDQTLADTHRNWEAKFQQQRKVEELTSKIMISAARKVLEEAERVDGLLEKPVSERPLDQVREHKTGRADWNGVSGRASDVPTKIRARCDSSFEALTAKSTEAGSHVGLLNRGKQFYQVGRPLIHASILGVAAVNTVTTGYRTYQKYGQDPLSANAQRAEQERLKQAARATVESSFESQLGLNRERFDHFFKTLSIAIRSEKDPILEKLRRASASSQDWKEQEALDFFESDSSLMYELLQSVISVKQGDKDFEAMKSMNVPEFQAFLALGPQHQESLPTYQAFVHRVVERSLKRISGRWSFSISGHVEAISKKVLEETSEDKNKTKVPETWVPHPLVPKLPDRTGVPFGQTAPAPTTQEAAPQGQRVGSTSTTTFYNSLATVNEPGLATITGQQGALPSQPAP